MNMKTAAEDLVCLDGTYEESIECNHLLLCQVVICEWPVNSMKVDYPVPKGQFKANLTIDIDFQSSASSFSSRVHRSKLASIERLW